MTGPSDQKSELSRRTLLAAVGVASIAAGASAQTSAGAPAPATGAAGGATSAPIPTAPSVRKVPGGALPRASRKVDVIVIGAGSAGSTLAGRLIADSTRKVILIEAGGGDDNPVLGRPLLCGMLAGWESVTWPFKTAPAPATNRRALSTMQGRLIGGGSSINGMVWMRGRESNFNDWAAMGLTDWSWEKVLANYRRIERYRGADASDYRGEFGQLPVQQHPATNPLFKVFLKAAGEAGLAVTNDINGPQEGAALFDCNFAQGSRWSAARAFLDPVKDNDNLSIITHAQVGRIIIENGRATGVLVKVRGKTERIDADEVVLSAGAFNSPKLLMLSGVGPADELRALGIGVVLDRPGVGENLHDHIGAAVTNSCSQPVTLFSETRMDRATLDFLRAWAFGTGPAAESPFGAGALTKSTPDATSPDLQVYLIPALTTSKLRLPFTHRPGDGHGYTCDVQIVQPKSRGKLSLRGADPRLAPIIQPNYLADPADRDALRTGIKLAREILAQPAFDSYRGAELKPGESVASDAELDAWIANSSGPGLHLVGTCKMGLDSDPMAVVDSELRVHGVDGLRVADSSAIPKVTSGNTNAPSIMVGYRCANFILGQDEA